MLSIKMKCITALHSLHTPKPTRSALQAFMKCLQHCECVYLDSFLLSLFNKHDGPKGKEEITKGRERERGCVPHNADQAQPHKAGVILLSTVMAQSRNKLQGCLELYRNLLLTAESHPGVPYSYNAPTHHPAANTARHPVKEYHTISFHKTHYIALFGQKRRAHRTVDVNKRGTRVRNGTRRRGNDREREEDTLLREENGRSRVKRG